MTTALQRDELAAGIETLGQWFPETRDLLRAHKDEIITLIRADTAPPAGSPLSNAPSVFTAAPAIAATAPSLTPCEQACGVVAVDAVLFAVGLVGLHISNQQRLARMLVAELAPSLNGLSRSIRQFEEADTAIAKAKALFGILGGIYSAGGFRVVFTYLKDELTWWEWIKTGAIAVAQITAWFATDGVAFIAEAALSVMSAEQLIEDSVTASNACN